jgi:hypothetical protein
MTNLEEKIIKVGHHQCCGSEIKNGILYPDPKLNPYYFHLRLEEIKKNLKIYLFFRKIYYQLQIFSNCNKNVQVGFGSGRIRNKMASCILIRKKYLRIHNTSQHRTISLSKRK